MSAPNLYQKTITTPLGTLDLFGTTHGLTQILFPTEEEEVNQVRHFLPEGFILSEESHPILEQCAQELTEYFDGNRREFTISFVLHGTDFQQKVWNALNTVPYGETRTYLNQSEQLGNKKAIRAVASANGKNKIPILIPCHRIIGSDGSLTGYAGGIERKRFLLRLEQEHAGPEDLFSMS